MDTQETHMQKRTISDGFDGNLFWLNQVGVSSAFAERYAPYLYFDTWLKSYSETHPFPIGIQKLTLSARLFRNSVWCLSERKHATFYETFRRIATNQERSWTTTHDRFNIYRLSCHVSNRKRVPRPTLCILSSSIPSTVVPPRKKEIVVAENLEEMMELLILSCFYFPGHFKNRWKTWHFASLPKEACKKPIRSNIETIISMWYEMDTERALVQSAPAPLKGVAYALRITLCELLFPYSALLDSDSRLAVMTAKRESELQHLMNQWIVPSDITIAGDCDDDTEQSMEYKRISRIVHSPDIMKERIFMIWKCHDHLRKDDCGNDQNMHVLLVIMITLYTGWMSLPRESAECSDWLHFAFSSLYMYQRMISGEMIVEKTVKNGTTESKTKRSQFLSEHEALQWIKEGGLSNHREASGYTDLVSNASKMCQFIYQYFTEDIDGICEGPSFPRSDSVIFAMLLNAGISHSNAMDLARCISWPPYHFKDLPLTLHRNVTMTGDHIKKICTSLDWVKRWDFSCKTYNLRKECWVENLEMIRQHYGILAYIHTQNIIGDRDRPYSMYVLDFCSYAKCSLLLDGISWFLGTYVPIFHVGKHNNNNNNIHSELHKKHSHDRGDVIMLSDEDEEIQVEDLGETHIPHFIKSSFSVYPLLRHDNACAIMVGWKTNKNMIRCSETCWNEAKYCSNCDDISKLFYGWSLGLMFDTLKLTSLHMTELHKLYSFVNTTSTNRKAISRVSSELPYYGIFGLSLSRAHDALYSMTRCRQMENVRSSRHTTQVFTGFNVVEEGMQQTLHTMFDVQASIVLRTFSIWIQGTQVDHYLNLIDLSSAICGDELLYGRFLAASAPILWNLVIKTTRSDGNAERALTRLLYFVQMLTIHFTEIGTQEEWNSHLLFIQEPGEEKNDGGNIVCPTLYHLLTTEDAFIGFRKRYNKGKQDLSESSEDGGIGNLRKGPLPEEKRVQSLTHRQSIQRHFIDGLPEHSEFSERARDSDDSPYDDIDSFTDDDDDIDEITQLFYQDQLHRELEEDDFTEFSEHSKGDEEDDVSGVKMFHNLCGNGHSILPKRMYLQHSLWKTILRFCLLNLWVEQYDRFSDIVSELFFYCCPILHSGDSPPSDVSEFSKTPDGNCGEDSEGRHLHSTEFVERPFMPEDRLFRTHYNRLGKTESLFERKQVIHGLYIGRGRYNQSEIHPFPFGSKSASSHCSSHYSRFSLSTSKDLYDEGFTRNTLTAEEILNLNPFVCISLVMEMSMYTQDQDLAKDFIMEYCSGSGSGSSRVESFVLYKEASLYPYSDPRKLSEITENEDSGTFNGFEYAGVTNYQEFSKVCLDSMPVRCDTVAYLSESDKHSSNLVFTRYGETLSIPEQFVGRGWEGMNDVSSSFLADMLFYYGKDTNNQFV